MQLMKVPLSQQFINAVVAIQQEIGDKAPKDAFDIVDNEVRRGVDLTHKTLLYTCQLIAIQKKNWDNMGLDDQHRIAESFYQYISARFGITQKSVTVDNYINTARTWLLDPPMEIPERVFYHEIKNDQVQMVADDGQSFERPTDVWDINYSKLLAANARAARGKMEEEDWGLLFNPAVSQEQLLSVWRGSKTPKEKRAPFDFVLIGEWLAAQDENETVQLGEMDFETIEAHPLAQQAWQRLRTVLRVQEDDF